MSRYQDVRVVSIDTALGKLAGAVHKVFIPLERGSRVVGTVNVVVLQDNTLIVRAIWGLGFGLSRLSGLGLGLGLLCRLRRLSRLCRLRLRLRLLCGLRSRLGWLRLGWFWLRLRLRFRFRLLRGFGIGVVRGLRLRLGLLICGLLWGTVGLVVGRLVSDDWQIVRGIGLGGLVHRRVIGESGRFASWVDGLGDGDDDNLSLVRALLDISSQGCGGAKGRQGE